MWNQFTRQLWNIMYSLTQFSNVMHFFSGFWMIISWMAECQRNFIRLAFMVELSSMSYSNPLAISFCMKQMLTHTNTHGNTCTYVVICTCFYVYICFYVIQVLSLCEPHFVSLWYIHFKGPQLGKLNLQCGFLHSFPPPMWTWHHLDGIGFILSYH